MLDPYTFGASKAAVILAERLDRIADPKLTRRVGAFLHYTYAGFAQLGAVEDEEWFRRFVVLFRKSQLAKVDYHADVDSYVKNLVLVASKGWCDAGSSSVRLVKGSRPAKAEAS
jgi:hypothetical protein